MKSKTKRLVHGAGINDADYSVAKNEYRVVDGNLKSVQVWRCPFYSRWKGMLERCYSDKLKQKHPTYEDCTVCEEWLTFSNFKSWMEKQEWEGKQLDKDLLIPGNKHYSPSNCIFVSAIINSFLTESDKKRGSYLIGVCFEQATGLFLAQCQNPFSGRQEKLGRFKTEKQAHEAWLKRKLELAKLIAVEQDNQQVAEALIKRYENYGARQSKSNA